MVKDSKLVDGVRMKTSEFADGYVLTSVLTYVVTVNLLSLRFVAVT